MSAWTLFSQEKDEESFKKSFRSELKMVESKLARRPNDINLHYKFGLLCYKLCRYRDAQSALYKCIETYKDNAYFYLDLYNVEIALKNKVQADEFYYKYKSLEKNSGLAANSSIIYQELTSQRKPHLASKKIKSIEYFPYILENDKLKFLTISDYTYLEPTSPLLFRNYLTTEVGFSSQDFDKPKIVKQPEKTSEGFSYSAFCLNKNQNRIYMTRYDGNNRRMIICVSDKEERSWGPFKTIRYMVKHPKFNFMHPMLTESEDQLVFTSDLKGGAGGLDLWIADLTETGDIKNIHNLGKKINTIGNECFPTMYDQNSFFFSSDGHHGYGSLDLYKADLLTNGTASEPINLGSSFNSSRDDYGLFYSKDRNTAFFTSNRSATNANLYWDKIYKIKLNVFDCEVLSFEIKNPFARQEEIADQKNSIGDNKVSSADNSNSAAEESTSNSTQEKKLESNKNLQPVNNTTTITHPNPSNQNAPHKTRENTKEEKVDLYNTKSEKIEEKFVEYSDKVSISNLNTNAIVENKFWTTAKLIFKDIDIEIGYTYVKVINPKQEVVYSNYSTKNGMISLEVLENNEYTIEIPRFKTMIQGAVFSKNENSFYFPYISETIHKPREISIDNANEKSKPRASNSTSQNNSKSKLSNSNISKSAPSNKNIKPSSLKPVPSAIPKSLKPSKKVGPQKSAPNNMIENFS